MVLLTESVCEGILYDKIREDSEKIQIIMQYLESRGLMKTLAQLEEETGSVYSPERLSEGGVFDVLVDSRTSCLDNEKNSCVEEEEFKLPIPGSCATGIECVRNQIHASFNPTSVVWSKAEADIVFSGGVDSKILKWKLVDGEIVRYEQFVLSVPSPVLYLDSSLIGHVVASCMGGEVVVFHDGKDGQTEPTAILRPHGTNRVTYASFSPNGRIIATCGRDIAVAFTQLNESGEWVSVEGSTIRFEREVSSICWISDEVIAVAETGNCMIGLYRIVNGTKELVGELCMNKSVRDPRSSYSMLAMTYHEELGLLAGCTSRNSAILFKLPDEMGNGNVACPIKTYYGMSIGIYDFPSIEFSVDGSFLYVTSDKHVLVFETKTCHKVFSICGSESKPIRSVKRDLLTDRLASVSFDKCLYVMS